MNRPGILAVLVPALVVGSCAVFGPENKYEIPKISGCVVDAEFKPLEGVRVELTFPDEKILWQGKTDKEGRFLYSGKEKFNLFRNFGIGDRSVFVAVKIYKKSNVVFSELYDVLALARENKKDRILADLTKRNWSLEDMADIGMNEPSCFVI